MQISKLSLCIGGVGILAVFARYGMTQERFDTPQLPRHEDPTMPMDLNEHKENDSFHDRSPNPGASEDTDPFDARTVPQFRSPGPMREQTVTRAVRETIIVPIPAEEIAAAKRLHDAIVLLNNSKDDDAREKAKITIQEQLQLQFQNDLKKREAELLKVEKRVETLREQFDKRKAAQDDIIKLRLQTLVNEASGLGFPPSYSARPQTTSPFATGTPYAPNKPMYPDARGMGRNGDDSWNPGLDDGDADFAVPESARAFPAR